MAGDGDGGRGFGRPGGRLSDRTAGQGAGVHGT